MCGIVAYSGPSKFSKDKIKMALMYNEERGKDACGFYNHDTSIPFEDRIFKIEGLVSKKMIPSIGLKETNLFIGHVRAATQGHAKTISNAHPFIFNNIVGVHNGTVKNWTILKREHKLSDEVNMDSKTFFAYLDKYEDTEILSQFEGAANLVWVDKKDKNTMYIFKHEDRSLFRGTIKNKDGSTSMYISSLEEALKAIECNNIQKFKDQRLYTIKEGKIVKNKAIASNPLKEATVDADARVLRESEAKAKREAERVVEEKKAKLPFQLCTLKEHHIINNGLVKWKVEKFSDLTVSRRRKVYSLPSIIVRQEIILCPKRAFHILKVEYNDGGYHEFRLGLPGIHFNPENGERLLDLAKDTKTELISTSDDFLSSHIDIMNDLHNKIGAVANNLRANASSSIEEEVIKLDKLKEYIEHDLTFATEE